MHGEVCRRRARGSIRRRLVGLRRSSRRTNASGSHGASASPSRCSLCRARNLSGKHVSMSDEEAEFYLQLGCSGTQARQGVPRIHTLGLEGRDVCFQARRGKARRSELGRQACLPPSPDTRRGDAQEGREREETGREGKGEHREHEVVGDVREDRGRRGSRGGSTRLLRRVRRQDGSRRLFRLRGRRRWGRWRQ